MCEWLLVAWFVWCLFLLTLVKLTKHLFFYPPPVSCVCWCVIGGVLVGFLYMRCYLRKKYPRCH